MTSTSYRMARWHRAPQNVRLQLPLLLLLLLCGVTVGAHDGWLELIGSPPLGAASGELNYCSKIEEDTNYKGQDIRYANRSNHWFPATISTCCASCRNSLQLDPTRQAACVCWVFGHNNNGDCQESNFKEGEGCCWLKQMDKDGGACKTDRVSSSSQVSGFFIEGEPHEGGLPSHESGWAIVVMIMGFAFVGGAYSRVSPGFGRNLKGLVADGIAFTTGVATGASPAAARRAGRGGGYEPVEKEAEAVGAEEAAADGGGAGRGSGKAGAAVGGGGGARAAGERTALHAAAAIGERLLSNHIFVQNAI